MQENSDAGASSVYVPLVILTVVYKSGHFRARESPYKEATWRTGCYSTPTPKTTSTAPPKKAKAKRGKKAPKLVPGPFQTRLTTHPIILSGAMPRPIIELCLTLSALSDAENQILESNPIGPRAQQLGLYADVPPTNPYSATFKTWTYAWLAALAVDWLLWTWQDEEANDYAEWRDIPLEVPTLFSLSPEQSESRDLQVLGSKQHSNMESHKIWADWLSRLDIRRSSDGAGSQTSKEPLSKKDAAVMKRLRNMTTEGVVLKSMDGLLGVYRKIFDYSRFLQALSLVSLVYNPRHWLIPDC
jgi:hypothetical protein